MRKTLPSCIAMVLALLTTLPLQAQVKDRAYYENLSIYYAYGANQAGEDPLYGGGHGLVIRASVSPTWTSTSLAGSGITASNDYPDPNPDVFGLSTPYRAIFKDEYCNRTGYFTHDAPTRVYLGGFKPIGAGGVEEDVYFTVLRTGTANASLYDADWAGRGSQHVDLRANGTTGRHSGDDIAGYVVVGKGLTPAQLVTVRAKVAQEEAGNLPDYEDNESSYLSGFYSEPTFCSEAAIENAASYTNVPGQSRTITIPSFIMLDQEFADPNNELGAAYKNRHIILKVVGIDFGAFSDVENTHFILPKGITYIGDSGLRKTGYTAPKKISFHKGSNVYPYIGETCTDAEWADYNNIESVGHYGLSYAQYDAISDVVNLNKIKAYGDHSFQGWTSLTSLNLGSMPLTTRVARGAFAYCPNLASVQIANNIHEIGEQAFYGCGNLTSLTFVAPSGDPTGATMPLTTIGGHAFEGATNLTTFIPPASLKTVGDYAFYDCNLGAGGRFDVPKHIEHIGEYALANNGISYIPFVAGTDAAPENPVSDNGLFLGYRAFYEPGNDVTVEFNAITPPRITSSGRPFETDADHRVRIIVPISSGECYKHAVDRNQNKIAIGGLFSTEYHHHEYRVKFDLTKTYTKPNYGLNTGKEGDTWTYVTAPWWVASSSWMLDNYVLKPSHGGSVDTWAQSTTTNNMGETKAMWTATEDYFIHPDGSATPGVVYGEQHVFPRSAHQYFSNEQLDGVPKISTMEVEDGILPPDEGLLLAYTHPAIYLMPLYADYGLVSKVVKTVPQKFGVEVNTVTVNDATTDLTRFKIHSRLLTFDSDENLVALAGKSWLDLNSHLAKWRQIAVWNDAGTDYEIKWVDLLNMKDRDGNAFVMDPHATVTVTGTFTRKWNGTSYDNLASDKYVTMNNVTVKKYDYWTNSSGRPYRCAAGFNKYTIPSNINWAEASELGAEHLKALLGDPVDVVWFPANYSNTTNMSMIGTDNLHKVLFYNYVPCTHKWVHERDTTIYGTFYAAGDTILCGNQKAYNNGGGYGIKCIEDWHCRQWIDIFDLIQEWGMSPGEVQARHDFHDNHTDHGNILVACIEPTYVWPFWEIVDEDTYNADLAVNENKVSIARKYYKDVNDEWTYDPYFVSGRSSVLMDGDTYADGFVSFGLSNGCFVQSKNPGLTKANRAYFRVHTSVLHTSLYQNTTVFPTTRMVIVDQAHMDGASGVVTGLQEVGHIPTEAVWYTIDGRRLNGRPTRSGVYVRNGQKMVIQ